MMSTPLITKSSSNFILPFDASLMSNYVIGEQSGNKAYAQWVSEIL